VFVFSSSYNQAGIQSPLLQTLCCETWLGAVKIFIALDSVSVSIKYTQELHIEKIITVFINKIAQTRPS